MSEAEVATTAQASPLRGRLLFALRLLVSTGLLAVLFQYADMGSVLQRFRGAAPLPLLLSFALLGVQILMSSTKWQLILRADGLDVGYLKLLKINATSSFANLFLPSSFGGDVYRVIALRKVTGGLVRSTASVLFDRGSGLFALVTIAVVSYQFYPDNPFAGIMVAGWVAAIVLFAVATSSRVQQSTLWPRMKSVQHLRSLLGTLRVYRSNGHVLLKVIALSLGFQLIMVVINLLYARALGIDIAFATLLVIIPLVYLTEVIPLSINGIGVRDTAFVIAFAAIGRPAEEAIAMSVMLISMRYAFGFLCGSAVLATMLKDNNRGILADEAPPQRR
jgi:hypothetical protein